MAEGEATHRASADVEAQTSTPAQTEPFPPLRHARTTFRAPRQRSLTSQQYNPQSARGRRWQPGQEPGLSPDQLVSGNTPRLQAHCDITLVVFTQSQLQVSFYGNASLLDLLDDLSKADAKSCKWINVNGLSWDVVSALAKAKRFHRLAIEDVLSRGNRTKADWYSDHAYIVLPLQKLIRIGDEEDQEHEETPGNDGKPGFLRRLFMKKKKSSTPAFHGNHREKIHTDPVHSYAMNSSFAQLKKDDGSALTLQRYHGGVNKERIKYMEDHSALKEKNVNVAVEQVSLFLMSDNTVVSFFEHSAEDIESPILTRLNSKDTILRASSDASMLIQAIIDGIVDLAIPVTAAYHDAIDELELNVLTSPSIKHTSSLYILQSEVSQFRATISPILGLIDTLRDHSSPFSATALDPNSQGQARPPNFRHNTTALNADPVTLSQQSKVYLADVADHVQVVSDSLEQMRRAADNMTDLIFNTVSAYQNESMRQLTMVTIVFLPLTFITGYFGQNFTDFAGIQGSDILFWQIALPVCFVLAIWVLRDVIYRYFTMRRQRFGIQSSRKKRGIKTQ